MRPTGAEDPLLAPKDVAGLPLREAVDFLAPGLNPKERPGRPQRPP